MRRLLFVLMLLAALAAPALADSHTWQNGGVDTLWDTAGNWTPAGPPIDGDTCIFPNAVASAPTGNYSAAGRVIELIGLRLRRGGSGRDGGTNRCGVW